MAEINQDADAFQCDGDAAKFDYDGASPSVRKFLISQAERIRRYAAKSIVAIGKDLIAAKHFLSHGAFLRWVEAEVGIPARTAQGYMSVAEWVVGKSATVAHLPPTLLYILAARSTPAEYSRIILSRIEAGEDVVISSIRNDLKAIREERKVEYRQKRNAPDASLTWSEQSTQAKKESSTAQTSAVNGEEVDAVLRELVAILVHSLSGADFARTREILTNRHVLDDARFAKKVEAAFLTAAASAGRLSAAGQSSQFRLRSNREFVSERRSH